MKILVTGGSGFIGNHVVDNLLKKNYKVVIFDRYKKEKREDVEYFYGDIRDWESISEAIYKCDGVIHLAGILGTQETVKNPLPAVQTNILGSLNVFEACYQYNKKCVYIAVGNHWMNNPYSITKTTAERFALMYNKERGTKIAIVRGFNAYGPRQQVKPVRKIIPNFILPALKNEDILIYGNGEQKMDMIYVEDLAEILVRALIFEHNCYDKIFEGGTGIAPIVNEIAEAIIELTNSKSKINHTEMRPGEDKDSVVKADINTLRPILAPVENYKFVSLEQGLKNTIEWYKEHET
jgi:nucleoside-diphosphate-sugar epimerase